MFELLLRGLPFFAVPLTASPASAIPAADPAAAETFRNAGVVIGALLLVVIIALLAHYVLFRLLLAAAKRSPRIPESVVRRLRLPSQLGVAGLAGLFILPRLTASPRIADGLRHAFALILILALTMLAVRGLMLAARLYLARFDMQASDNLGARRVHTQLLVVSRILGSIIWLIGIAAAIMTFPSVRQLGTSILASAGIAGLVVGLAAQRTLGNFLAGLQIALSEPINLDDVVIVENEWGRVEEITATYVVVKIWDERRLIVPFSWFIERPFENWTRRTSQILGTVFLWMDYSVPVDDIRREARRIAEASADWDRRVIAVQVTDTTDRAVQVRVLASAPDAGKAFSLRCELREKLIAFLQREHPAALPRTRAFVDGGLELAGVGSDQPTLPGGGGNSP